MATEQDASGRASLLAVAHGSIAIPSSAPSSELMVLSSVRFDTLKRRSSSATWAFTTLGEICITSAISLFWRPREMRKSVIRRRSLSCGRPGGGRRHWDLTLDEPSSRRTLGGQISMSGANFTIISSRMSRPQWPARTIVWFARTRRVMYWNRTGSKCHTMVRNSGGAMVTPADIRLKR